MASRNLGSLTIDLIARTFGFEQGMDKAARTASKRSKEIQSSITGSFKTIGASIAGFVAGLALVDTAVRGLNDAIDQADKLDELSARYDISTEKLSAWGYAAKLTGSDLEALTSAIPKFSKVVADAADATSESAKIFDALGISVKDQAGNLKTFQDLLPDVADRFKGITDQTLKTNLALQLFGKSGAQFLEFLSLGSDGLKTMEDRAKDLGIIISGETAAAAARFNDRLDDLRAASQGLFTELSGRLLPKLTDFVELLAAPETRAAIVNVAGWIGGITSELATGATQLVNYISRVQQLRALSNGGAVGDADTAALNDRLGKAAAERRQLMGWDPLTGDQKKFRQKRIDDLTKEMQTIQREVTNRIKGDTPIQDAAPQAWIDSLSAGAKGAADAQKALQDLLAGGGDGARAAGGSAADSVDQLTRRYQDLEASLKEQIALHGEVSQEAKLRYDLENTELSGLTQAQKESVLALVQQADAQERLTELQKAADDELKRQDEARRQQIEDAGTQIQQMQQELDLLGMTNKQRAVAIELSHLGAGATEEQRRQVEQLAAAYQDQLEQISVMDDLRDSFADFFSDVISGNKSITESFKDMLSSIGDMIAKRIAQNWVDQLFGQEGTSQGGATSGVLNWFAGLFTQGHANGGLQSANTIGEINERGFEMATVRGRQYLLAGSSPVEITPNHKIGMGGGVVNNFAFSAPVSSKTQTQVAARVGYEIGRAQRLG